MKWKIPPRIKIYEALGSIADNRIELSPDSLSAKAFSSSKGKFYSIKYDGKNSIMCNDNASYYKGYLGYPAIAFLMMVGRIHYNKEFSEQLKDIKWKDVNVEFKNDWEKTEAYVLRLIEERGFSKIELVKEIDRIFEDVKNLQMDHLGEKRLPPKGY